MLGMLLNKSNVNCYVLLGLIIVPLHIWYSMDSTISSTGSTREHGTLWGELWVAPCIPV